MELTVAVVVTNDSTCGPSGPKGHLLLVDVHLSGQDPLPYRRDDATQWSASRIELWIRICQEDA